jgi:hypothetical protein
MFSRSWRVAVAVHSTNPEKETGPMEMLLMGACLSVFGLAVACLAFGAATREERPASVAAAGAEVQAGVAKAVAPARFFVDPPVIPIAAHARVPIEALLLQLENHVRLEQAAAESFLRTPNPAMLHSRTSSSFVN